MLDEEEGSTSWDTILKGKRNGLGNDLAAQRRQVLAWTKRIADTGIGRLFLPHSIKFHSGRLVSATFATRSPLRMPKLCKPQARIIGGIVFLRGHRFVI